MGFSWGYRNEFGRRVGLSYNNHNASVWCADFSLLASYMRVSWDNSVVEMIGATACLVC